VNNPGLSPAGSVADAQIVMLPAAIAVEAMNDSFCRMFRGAG
jgi:hypothetical protein